MPDEEQSGSTMSPIVRRFTIAMGQGLLVFTAAVAMMLVVCPVRASSSRRSLNRVVIYNGRLSDHQNTLKINQPAPASSLCCSDFASFTNLDAGFPDVCGLSLGCKFDAGYEEARAHCEAVGARLCTHEELSAEEVKGTDCAFENDAVWSATPCIVPESGESSFIAAEGRMGTDPFCPTPNTQLGVGCCADAQCDNFRDDSSFLSSPAALPPNAALGKPTFQSSIGWGGDSSNAVDGNPTGVCLIRRSANAFIL
jgi:hypothetical protein